MHVEDLSLSVLQSLKIKYMYLFLFPDTQCRIKQSKWRWLLFLNIQEGLRLDIIIISCKLWHQSFQSLENISGEESVPLTTHRVKSSVLIL